jgi:hypothetical protein
MDLQHWAVYGTWFSGIATLAVVFIALYLQRRYENNLRPQLTIAYDEAASEEDGANRYLPPGLAGNPYREELWIRLPVKNISKITARDVEVRFIALRRERRGRENRPSWWLKVSNLNEVAVAIPSEFTQYFDVAFIEHDPSSSALDICFQLAIVHPPLLPWHEEKERIERRTENRLEIGFKYDLSFAVVSGNADARFYRMTLKAIPRATDDPLPSAAFGQEYLRGRVEVGRPESVSSEQAFGI